MKTLLLMSGLDIEGKSSFARQLAFLGNVLNKNGIRTVLCGPGPHGGSGAGPFGNTRTYKYRASWISDGAVNRAPSFLELVRKTGACAAVLLGYHDQFPFLRDGRPEGFPCFLWAQFSKQPDPSFFRYVLPVALTPKSLDFIRKAGFTGTCPIIPHGVDTSVYFPFSTDERARLKREMGLGGRFVVGTVGAHTSRKRFDIIVEAFSIFSVRVASAFLLMKTDRMRSLEEVDLGRVIGRRGGVSNVKIINADLSDEQMRRLYGVMDLYINLSEWEGFCIPVVEAMACGVPVMTHQVQGPGEIVPYDEYMVPGGAVFFEGQTSLIRADPVQAAHVLALAFSRTEFHEKLKKKGLDEVRLKFDMRVVAGLWERLIDERGL